LAFAKVLIVMLLPDAARMTNDQVTNDPFVIAFNVYCSKVEGCPTPPETEQMRIGALPLLRRMVVLPAHHGSDVPLSCFLERRSNSCPA
jgi:hypothetical protein